MDEPTSSALRIRRVETQYSLEEKLKAVCCRPPTDENLEEFATIRNDPGWMDPSKLVDELNKSDAVTITSEPKTFQNRFHKLLGYMLTDIGTCEQYLKRLINRFEAENELVVLDPPKGAKTSQDNQDDQRQHSLVHAPIHYAVMHLHEGLLDWLLRCERIDVNLRNNNRETALAILCEKYDGCLRSNRRDLSNAEDVQPQLARIRAMIKRLLEAGADFNICSMKPELPIELLLGHGAMADAETNTFVQQCVQQAGSALAVVKTNGSKRLVGFLNNIQDVRLTEELFEIFLRYKDVKKFAEYWNRFDVTVANVKKVIRLVLHTTLDQKLPYCLRLVVNKGGPLIFAVEAGQARNVFVVADQRSSEMEHRVELKGLLRKACEMADLGVLQLLMKKITDSILLTDDPLLALTLTNAFKAKRGSEQRTALLACAEFLANTPNINKWNADGSGNTPLHLALKYGFESVALALLKQQKSYLGLRNRNNRTPLDYGTYEFWKAYLDLCIDVKQVPGNDRRVVLFNLTCFDPFTHGKAEQSGAHLSGGKASKIVLDTTNANKQLRRYEMTTVRQIAQSRELKPLLFHPLVQTFILVEWKRLSHWNILNLALTVMTAVFFGTFSHTACSRDGPHPTCWLLTVVATVLMVTREVLKVLFLRQSYMSFENILNIGNVVAMSTVLWHGCNGLLSSLVMINLAGQVTILVGSLPLNSLSAMVNILKTVSKNFLLRLLMLFPVIGAFFCAFNLTYESQIQKQLKAAARDGCTDDKCAQGNYDTSLNVTMTTGYLELVMLNFADFIQRVFLLFLFIAPIVIMNMINSLAVRDIAAIREESEMISIVKKVMLLEQYERGVANIRPAFLRTLFPRPFFEEHNCWIRVQANEFRKIEVHPKKKTLAAATTMANTHHQHSAKFVPISIIHCVGDVRSKVMLNFWVFKFAMFMRLDQPILNEALAICKKRQLFAQNGGVNGPSQTTLARFPSTGHNERKKLELRKRQMATQLKRRRGVKKKGLKNLTRNLKAAMLELNGQMAMLSELFRSLPKRCDK